MSLAERPFQGEFFLVPFAVTKTDSQIAEYFEGKSIPAAQPMVAV
jgi:hypothetical protein